MLAFISSESVIIGVVVGIPLVVVATVIAATRPQLPRPALAGFLVVAVALVAISVWAVFRPGPSTVAAGARPASLPSAPAPAVTSAPPTSPPGPPPPPCSPSGTQLQISAQSLSFDKDCLAAPADTAVSLVFDNQAAGIPHNVEIFETAAAQKRLGGATDAGDFITGPKQVTYQIPALPAGTYFFRCDLHPAQMTGDFVVA